MDYIESQLTKCQDGIHLVYEMERKLYNDKIISLGDTSNDSTIIYSNKSLIQLESTLLNMASTPGLCQGVLYIFPVKLDNVTIVRFWFFFTFYYIPFISFYHFLLQRIFSYFIMFIIDTLKVGVIEDLLSK